MKLSSKIPIIDILTQLVLFLRTKLLPGFTSCIFFSKDQKMVLILLPPLSQARRQVKQLLSFLVRARLLARVSPFLTSFCLKFLPDIVGRKENLTPEAFCLFRFLALAISPSGSIFVFKQNVLCCVEVPVLPIEALLWRRRRPRRTPDTCGCKRSQDPAKSAYTIEKMDVTLPNTNYKYLQKALTFQGCLGCQKVCRPFRPELKVWMN